MEWELPGSGSRKRQPRGLKRLPALGFIGKRLLGGATNSGVRGLPYPIFVQEGLSYP